MKPTLGFLGIGAMGAPMSRRMLDMGYKLVIHDPLDERMQPLVEAGAGKAASAEEVADSADIVFICLPSLDVVREVILGGKGLVKGGRMRLLVNLGTTGQVLAAEMAEALSGKGVKMLDAPISGGPQGAIDGTLSVMASGPEDSYKEVEPILKAFGKTLVYVSDTPGHAQTLKLVNNILSATATAITAEAFVLAAKAGLDPEKVLEIVNSGSGINSATLVKIPNAVLTRTFDFGGTVNILHKDVSLCLAEADALGVPMWVGTAVKQMWSYMKSQGEGPNDLTNIVKHIEKWAGTEIPKTR